MFISWCCFCFCDFLEVLFFGVSASALQLLSSKVSPKPFSVVPLFPMIIEAENMTFEELRDLCDGMVCRNVLSPITLGEQPVGSFNFPAQELTGADNPMVHFFDVIFHHRDVINFENLERDYKKVNKEVNMQMIIMKGADESYIIFKHFYLAQKCKYLWTQDLAALLRKYLWPPFQVLGACQSSHQQDQDKQRVRTRR